MTTLTVLQSNNGWIYIMSILIFLWKHKGSTQLINQDFRTKVQYKTYRKGKKTRKQKWTWSERKRKYIEMGPSVWSWKKWRVLYIDVKILFFVFFLISSIIVWVLFTFFCLFFSENNILLTNIVLNPNQPNWGRVWLVWVTWKFVYHFTEPTHKYLIDRVFNASNSPNPCSPRCTF